MARRHLTVLAALLFEAHALEFIAPADGAVLTKCIHHGGANDPLLVSFAADDTAQLCVKAEHTSPAGVVDRQDIGCLEGQYSRTFALKSVGAGRLVLKANGAATAAVEVRVQQCDVEAADGGVLERGTYAWAAAVQQDACVPQRAPAASLLRGTGAGGAVRNEEQWLWLLRYVFPDLTHGTFVEAGGGALVGSHTFPFEQLRCWRGVVAEPVPAQAEALRTTRQGAEVVESALCAADGVAAPGFAVDGLLSGFSDTIIHADAEQRRLISVLCENAALLLARRGIAHVDLFVLDTEGSERAVLESFDFDLVEVDVWLVEANDPLAVEALLTARGYELVACLHRDMVFVHAERLLASLELAADDVQRAACASELVGQAGDS